MKKFPIKNTGAVSIPLVMGIGILLFLIVISITSIETARIYLSQVNIDSTQASEYAKAGVRDALEMLSRDNSFGTSTIKYNIDMKESGCLTKKYCATVSVSPNNSSTTVGRIIGVIAYYKTARRGLEVVVNYDNSGYGELNLISTEETLTPFGL